MRKVIAPLLVVAFGSLVLAEEPARLVVHEWGTFTSISGEDGVALDYRPLTGVSDLPSFVYTSMDPERAGIRTVIRGKGDLNGRIRMETPVIYFYSDTERKVSVKVDFPKGKITEFYPRALSLKDGTIDFGTVLVKPKATGPLIAETQRNHYFRAREVDADLVRVCSPGEDQLEKFLFYRGVGDFAPTVKVKLVEGGKKLRIEGLEGKAFVFENRGGESKYRLVEGAKDGSAVEVERPENPLYSKFWPMMDDELVDVLVDAGLYRKEAKAMVATWEESWTEEGLRVLYIVPRRVTDAVLPLTVTPKPTEVVRVLVGRAEVITPELESDVLAAVEKLGAEKFEVREAAQKSLASRGRFVRPILKTAAKRARDAEVATRIRQLLSD